MKKIFWKWSNESSLGTSENETKKYFKKKFDFYK